MTLNLAREVLEPMHQKKKSKSLLQPEAWWCSWCVSADITRRYEVRVYTAGGAVPS